MSQQRHPGVDSDAVLDAAASCYLRFGVAKTTAADIARELGISVKTVEVHLGAVPECAKEAVLAEAGDRDRLDRRCWV